MQYLFRIWKDLVFYTSVGLAVVAAILLIGGLGVYTCELVEIVLTAIFG